VNYITSLHIKWFLFFIVHTSLLNKLLNLFTEFFPILSFLDFFRIFVLRIIFFRIIFFPDFCLRIFASGFFLPDFRTIPKETPAWIKERERYGFSQVNATRSEQKRYFKRNIEYFSDRDKKKRNLKKSPISLFFYWLMIGSVCSCGVKTEPSKL